MDVVAGKILTCGLYSARIVNWKPKSFGTMKVTIMKMAVKTTSIKRTGINHAQFLFVQQFMWTGKDDQFYRQSY